MYNQTRRTRFGYLVAAGWTLAIAAVVLAVGSAYSEEDTTFVRVKCEPGKQSATIDNKAAFNDPNFKEDLSFKEIDIETLPTYISRQKGFVVCDLGARQRRISLTAGISEVSAQNNNVTINIGQDRISSLSFTGTQKYVQIRFHDDILSIRNCSKYPPYKEESCQIQNYRMAFQPTSLQTASFQCSHAETVTERLICDDTALAADDRMLESAFRKALAESSDKAKLLTDQRLWVSERATACSLLDRQFFPVDTVAAKACLRAAYEERLRSLLEVSSPK